MKHAPEFWAALEALRRGEFDIEHLESEAVDLSPRPSYAKPRPPILKLAGVRSDDFAQHIREVIEMVDERDAKIADLERRLEAISILARDKQ